MHKQQTHIIVNEASHWLVRLQEGGLSEQEQQQLEQWMQQTALHQKIWQNALNLQQDLQQLPPEVASEALLNTSKLKYRYNKYLWLIACIPVLSAIFYLNQQQHWSADYRNGQQQPRRISLPDGGLIVLDAQSAIDVDYSGKQRKIVLRKGQIWIETHADPQHRPFLVYTAQGTAEALGTQYLVQNQDKLTKVAVSQGAVRIRPILAAERWQIVQAGEQMQFDQQQISHQSPIDLSQFSWHQGFLMVNNMPLKEFIERLAVYQKGKIYLPDSLQHITITGTYPVDNIDKVYSMLERTYGLQVDQYLSGYLIKIKQRPSH